MAGAAIAQGSAGGARGSAAVERVMAALMDGLADHVIWLTLEEREEFDRRIRPWLQQELGGAPPHGTVEALAAELRAQPVPDPRVQSYYAGAREEWTLQSVDAVKRAVRRWLGCYPRTAEQTEAAGATARRVAAVFREWLGTREEPPAPEARQQVAARLEQELLGVPSGSIWAPLLRALSEDELEEADRWLRLPPPPRVDDMWEDKAWVAALQTLEHMWEVETCEVDTEEGRELAERLQARHAEAELMRAEREGWWEQTPQEHLQAARSRARDRGTRGGTAQVYWGTVQPFLIQALFCVRDRVEGRALILP